MVRDNGALKGKINWFERDKLIKLGLISSENEFINPTPEQLGELARRCAEHLKKEGFMFYSDSPEYREKLSKTGKIIEFGVQFYHIR
jgi:hypothetical protein